jgi:hypothetical protein
MARRAFGPKIMPLGLIKKRFALPLAPISPLIKEVEFPVTRVKILPIAGLLLKITLAPSGTEKRPKL